MAGHNHIPDPGICSSGNTFWNHWICYWYLKLAIYFVVNWRCRRCIFLAKYIRRRFGLDSFFGRNYGPNEIDQKLKSKQDNSPDGTI